MLSALYQALSPISVQYILGVIQPLFIALNRKQIVAQKGPTILDTTGNSSTAAVL